MKVRGCCPKCKTKLEFDVAVDERRISVNGTERTMTRDESRAFDGVMDSFDSTMAKADDFAKRFRRG